MLNGKGQWEISPTESSRQDVDILACFTDQFSAPFSSVASNIMIIFYTCSQFFGILHSPSLGLGLLDFCFQNWVNFLKPNGVDNVWGPNLWISFQQKKIKKTFLHYLVTYTWIAPLPSYHSKHMQTSLYDKKNVPLLTQHTPLPM